MNHFAAALRSAGPFPARAFGFASLLAFGLATQPALALDAPRSFADLAEKLLPSVVNVSTTQVVRTTGRTGGGDQPQLPPGSPFEDFFRDFFDRQPPGQGQGRQGQDQQRPQQPQQETQRRATSLGSGFVIDAAGLVVTNNHVIADAEGISVILQDGTSMAAQLVGKDVKTDLALLRVKPVKPLVAVKWGDSDAIRVGDWVVAIGNPFGLGGTVTAGILSARARDINAGPYDDFLQTDASINRGNSGGPLFNLEGEVVGINTAIFSQTGGSVGIGFAIPSSLARPVADQLGKFGKARRGWLGVNIQSVTDEIAEGLGLDKARGALVARVTENGPAEQAKILPGDVVIKFDGKDVTDMRRLPRLVAETAIDKPVKVTVWRRGREVVLDAKVGELDETEPQLAAVRPNARPGTPGAPPAPPSPVDALGLALSPITPELRERFEIARDVKGVVVTRVGEAGIAAETGLRAGDVIVEIGQDQVTSPAQVAAKVQEATKAGRKTMLVLLDRKGEQRFVAMRIDPKG